MCYNDNNDNNNSEIIVIKQKSCRNISFYGNEVNLTIYAM